VKQKEKLDALKMKTIEELNSDLASKKGELFNLRFQLATGQLQNTSLINECRKDIARVKTAIRQHELANKA
jgi:large subunit ribosomal protein L29